MTPYEYSVKVSEMAEEYARLADEMATLETKRAFKILELREGENCKSYADAERLYDVTEDGVRFTIIKHKLRGLDKLISAYKTRLRTYENEAKNQY